MGPQGGGHRVAGGVYPTRCLKARPPRTPGGASRPTGLKSWALRTPGPFRGPRPPTPEHAFMGNSARLHDYLQWWSRPQQRINESLIWHRTTVKLVAGNKFRMSTQLGKPKSKSVFSRAPWAVFFGRLPRAPGDPTGDEAQTDALAFR